MMIASSMWGQAGETEGPWTWMDMRSGCCDRTMNYSIAFNGLNNSHWGNITFWNDNDGIGYTVKGTSANQQKNGVFSTYYIDQNLESYSKKVLTWKFKVGSKDTKHYSNTALYALQGTWQQINALTVDFTEEYNNQAGSSYLIGRYRNTSYNKAYTGEITKTFAFDNSTGGSQATKSWCLLLTHVASSGDGMSDIHEWGAFLNVSYTWNTYYYKYVTYNGNGSTSGSMSAQTIENSGKLTNNAFSRTGYTFDGWATSATGNKAYDNQGDISATSGSKGNVTLYARWNVVNYTIGYTLNGGSVSGNPANYNVETASFTLVNPTRAGYTFSGWTGSNGNTPQTTVTIAKGSTGDKTYTANWAINPTTEVTYHMPDSIAEEVVDLNRPEAPAIDGFTFLRWEFIGAPLSDGIKLQAVYKKNNSNNAPKKVTVGEYTLEQNGDANEYILK